MTLFKKLLAATATTAATAVVATDVMAVTADVDVNANFREVIEIAGVTAMDFSDIEMPATIAGTEVIIVTTAGAYSGASGFSGAGTPAAGDINFTSSVGQTVNVTCETGGTLANAGDTASIDVDTVTWNFNGGADQVCGGIGVGAVGVVSTGDDNLLVGARLNAGTIVGTLTEEAYSTTLGSGDAVTFDLVYN